MALVYATDEKGERFLRYIECDRCDRQAKPGSDELLRGGWVRRGLYYWPGDTRNCEWDLCPDHA